MSGICWTMLAQSEALMPCGVPPRGRSFWESAARAGLPNCTAKARHRSALMKRRFKLRTRPRIKKIKGFSVALMFISIGRNKPNGGFFQKTSFDPAKLRGRFLKDFSVRVVYPDVNMAEDLDLPSPRPSP